MYKKNKGGFTLLEVMIAMTILSIAFASILTTQSSSINLTRKSKELNIAGWLAHNKMVESEHLYEGKPFTELPSDKSESFPTPFQNYRWKLEIKELKFPDLKIPLEGKESVPEPLRIFGQTISKYLSNALREMIITVTWNRGDGEMKIQLSTYLIDVNASFDFQI